MEEKNQTQDSFREEPINLGPLRIPAPMGIGTWAWGDSGTWGYGSYDPTFSIETMGEAFEFITKQGSVNFWDTAEVYGSGESERILSKFLGLYKGEVPTIVATKFLPFPWRLTQQSLISALEGSLKRLNLQAVDLYQVHGPATSLRSVEVWAEALAVAHQKGLTKAVGVSNYNADQVRRTHAVLAKHGIPLASNQIEYSLLRTNPEKNGLLQTCKELGVAVIAYSPLAMGRLTGKYSSKNPPKGNRKFSAFDMEEIEPLLNKLREIAEKRQKSVSQVAINWCICKGTIPIVGVKNKKQAEDNIQALGWRLTGEEVAQLDAFTKQSGWSIWQNDGR